jgi:hypothetical protein
MSETRNGQGRGSIVFPLGPGPIAVCDDVGLRQERGSISCYRAVPRKRCAQRIRSRLTTLQTAVVVPRPLWLDKQDGCFFEFVVG